MRTEDVNYGQITVTRKMKRGTAAVQKETFFFLLESCTFPFKYKLNWGVNEKLILI